MQFVLYPNLKTEEGRKNPKDGEKVSFSQKKVLLDDSYIESAKAEVQTDEDGESVNAVRLTFNKKGRKLFADITRKHIGERLALVIQGRLISAPSIARESTRGEVQITKYINSREEAEELAELLN